MNPTDVAMSSRLSSLSSLSSAFAGKPTPTPHDIRQHCNGIASNNDGERLDAPPSYVFQPPSEPVIDVETVQVCT